MKREEQRGRARQGAKSPNNNINNINNRVDFQVMGENKILQEKNKKRSPMDKYTSSRSPKKQCADIEHAMNRYLHETKI